jgi:hypothetical protein
MNRHDDLSNDLRDQEHLVAEDAIIQVKIVSTSCIKLFKVLVIIMKKVKRFQSPHEK